MAKTFNCDYCGESIKYEDVGGDPHKDGGSPICDDCYREHYTFDCPLCEDYHSKKEYEGVDRYFFVVMPDDVEEAKIESGIYRAIAFPVWVGDMFSVSIQKQNIQLVKALDKGELPDKGYHTNQICEDCFKEYTKEPTT